MATLGSRLESSLQLADTQKIVQSATIESSFATMVKGGASSDSRSCTIHSFPPFHAEVGNAIIPQDADERKRVDSDRQCLRRLLIHLFGS